MYAYFNFSPFSSFRKLGKTSIIFSHFIYFNLGTQQLKVVVRINLVVLIWPIDCKCYCYDINGENRLEKTNFYFLRDFTWVYLFNSSMAY